MDLDHLSSMEALRVTVTMESYQQKDPLIVYKNQSATMYNWLIEDMRIKMLQSVFSIKAERES